MKNLILFSLILFLSCSKDNETKKVATNIYANVDISLQNQNGTDLLDNGSYPASNFEVKYLINGNNVNPPYAGSQPYLCLKETLYYKRLRIYLNSPLETTDAYPITYIKWSVTDTDTIKAHYITGASDGIHEDYVSLDKLWINGVLINNLEEPGHFVKLIK